MKKTLSTLRNLSNGFPHEILITFNHMKVEAVYYTHEITKKGTPQMIIHIYKPQENCRGKKSNDVEIYIGEVCSIYVRCTATINKLLLYSAK